MDRTKLLVWSDYCAPTGFATVMSNILRRLDPDEFDIDVLAVNHWGEPDYDHARFPGRVFPSVISSQHPYNDRFGRQHLIDRARKGDYDTIFILQDMFNTTKVMPALNKLRASFAKKFRIVYYFPVDGPPWKNWVKDTVSQADVSIVYTLYGYEICVEADPSLHGLLVIPHGVDHTTFFQISEEFAENKIDSPWCDPAFYRKTKYPKAVGKFMLGNINRNQPRKDIARSLMLLREIKKTRDDVCMYLHMSLQDVGGDFTPVAAQLDLKLGEDYFLPVGLSDEGFPPAELNVIYNMVDAVFTTSLGEGWGLSLTEAMATRTPVIGPDHTAISEILDKGDEIGRGILCPAGENLNFYTVIDSDNMTLRPVTDIVEMAKDIDLLIKGIDTEPYMQMIENARRWTVKELDWNILAKKWRRILAKPN